MICRSTFSRAAGWRGSGERLSADRPRTIPRNNRTAGGQRAGRRAVSLPYPASDRHGCTPMPPLPMTTASVRRLPHLAQRNLRSINGGSPWPASTMAWRSAGPWGGRPCNGQTGWSSQSAADCREVVCHLMRPVLSCSPRRMARPAFTEANLGRLAVAISGRPFRDPHRVSQTCVVTSRPWTFWAGKCTTAPTIMIDSTLGPSQIGSGQGAAGCALYLGRFSEPTGPRRGGRTVRCP
jgi:hypothetical protein